MQAYAIIITTLRDVFNSFDPEIQKELLEYVPMGDNYCIGPPESELKEVSEEDMNLYSLTGQMVGGAEEYDPLYERKYNGLRCNCILIDYYHNSTMSLSTLMTKKYINEMHHVIVHQDVFEKIKAQILGSLLRRGRKREIGEDNCTIWYMRCIYDSSREEAFEYVIYVKNIVKLLESENQKIQKWLETIPNKGFVNVEDASISNTQNHNSYQIQYKNSLLSVRQHASMYHRDQNQCNYNTVNHGSLLGGLTYMLSLSQYQFDLLKDAYIESKESTLPKLNVLMKEIPNTNTMIKFLDERYVFLERQLRIYEDDAFERKKEKRLQSKSKVDRCCVS